MNTLSSNVQVKKLVNVIPERPKTKGKISTYAPADKTKDKTYLKFSLDSARSEPMQLKKSTEQGQRRRLDQDKDSSEYSMWFSDKQEPVPFQALPLLKQRLGHLLDEKFHTDVIFRVGPKEDTVEAHRLILASASPVFEKLLFDSKPLSFDDKMILHEADCSLVTFEAFIKALYTGEVPICLTLTAALEVFYVAKRYDVKFLQKLVLEHVSQVVTTVNVFEALAVSTKMVELTSMIPVCWRIIEEETDGVLDHHLETMEQHMFARILEREQLNMEEVELFQYLVKWATLRCKRRGLKTTGKLKRQMVEPLLKYIRFPTMKAATIHELVVPTRILDTKEVTAILTHVHDMDHKMSVPYKTTPRRKLLKFKQVFTGCFSSPKMLPKGKGSSQTQMFSSDSEDASKLVTCNKIKTKSRIETAKRTVPNPVQEILSPRPSRSTKKSPSKHTKRPLRSRQR